MINHWLNKEVGTVRLTNMHLGSLTYNLPMKFRVQSTQENRIRCLISDNEENEDIFEWIDQEHINYLGKKYKLKYSPAFSMVLFDFVFTIDE